MDSVSFNAQKPERLYATDILSTLPVFIELFLSHY